LLIAAYKKLEENPIVELEEALPVYKPEVDPNQFEIKRENGDEWRVYGVAIERAAKMTFWEHHGSVRRFQRLMQKLGVDEALKKAGVQEGDTVFVGDFELEWQE
jgi:GTP-binding protein